MDRAAAVATDARRDLSIEFKNDGSIVTNVDRAVETFLRKELEHGWPGTSFWGEEFGKDSISDKGYWLIDPIDGTSNFAFGSPLWGISVGFAMDGELSFGAVWLSDLDEKYLAETGKGAFLNRSPLDPIPPGAIEPFHLISRDTLEQYAGQSIPGKMRYSGAFVVDGTFTATQRYRGMIGKGEYLYDAAACVVLNRELGADIRWANGEALDYPELIGGRRFDRAWVICPKDSEFFLED